MWMFQLPVFAEIVNHRNLPTLLILGRLLRPHFGHLRTRLPVLLHPGLHFTSKTEHFNNFNRLHFFLFPDFVEITLVTTHNQITLDLTVLSKPLKYSTDQTPRNEENKLNSKIQYRHENAER